MFVPAVLDMQQMYNMWLTLNAHNRQSDEAAATQSISEKKNIIMPTDYAELEVGVHRFFPQKVQYIGSSTPATRFIAVLLNKRL